jgi:hypothetical protein
MAMEMAPSELVACSEMGPSEFAREIKDAIEDESVSSRFAQAHVRLFSSVQPLTGVSRQIAELKKQEKFLRNQINNMRDDFRLRKQIDEDSAILPKAVVNLFMPPAADSDSDGDENDDDDDFLEYAIGHDDGDDDDALDNDDDGGKDSKNDDQAEKNEQYVVVVSPLRKDLLKSGIPASVLNFNTEGLAPDIARMSKELVCVPYYGELCFLYVIKPEIRKDGAYDVSEVCVVLRRLQDFRDTPSISGLAGATDFRGHVIVAIFCPMGPSLKRIVRSMGDGELRPTAALHVLFALDLAKAVKRIHGVGLAHGAISATHVMIDLHAPCKATLLFSGLGSRVKSMDADVFDLGLVMASMVLRRVVLIETDSCLPDLANELDRLTLDIPLRQLIKSMLGPSNRPSSSSVEEALRAMVQAQGIDDGARSLVHTAAVGSISTIYELHRNPSPLRRSEIK